MPEQFKLRDLVEVSFPETRVTHVYALVNSVGRVDTNGPVVGVTFLATLSALDVKPEWCRLVPMTLIVKDGEWRLE